MYVKRFHFAAVLFFALTFESLAAQAQAPSCNPSVQAPAGTICGTSVSNGAVSAYLGIPYAEPPVGSLRWQNPQAYPAGGTIMATQRKSICPQEPLPPFYHQTCSNPPTLVQDEDCLYLNVWVPAGTTSTANLPVMVFIHGGAFIQGTGASPVFDGSSLATRENVIVVTINYRLGVLGFLTLNGITTASNNNFGFRDQILALQWVQSNIGSFGGNPKNVTIFGESAGAMSVGLHVLASSQSSNLFQKALMESNPLALPYKSMVQAQSLGTQFQATLPCPQGGSCSCDVTCMRAMSWQSLMNYESTFKPSFLSYLLAGLNDALVWGPVIDGTLLTGQPIASGLGGTTPPILVGTNQADGNVFVDIGMAKQGKSSVSSWDFKGLVFLLAPLKLVQISAAYPCSPAGDCTVATRQLFTDYLFTCSNRHLASNAAKNGSNLYAYQFTQVTSSFNVWASYGVTECATQVCHGEELPYVFSTPQGVCPTDSFMPAEQTASNAMMDYWGSFATTGAPKGANVAWPAFQSLSKTYMILNSSPAAANDPLAATAHCDIWDSVGYENASIFSSLLAAKPAAKLTARKPSARKH
jgi:carboxylesterase type B